MLFQGIDWLSSHGIYEPLYHACCIAGPLNSLLVVLAKWNQQDLAMFLDFLNKIILIIPHTLVGYEMIIANSALRASLAIYHLISNARWVYN